MFVARTQIDSPTVLLFTKISSLFQQRMPRAEAAGCVEDVRAYTGWAELFVMTKLPESPDNEDKFTYCDVSVMLTVGMGIPYYAFTLSIIPYESSICNR